MSEDANRAELPPDRLTTLWRRIKQHRIAQWTVGYVAVAYGIQHAVTLTSEAFKWPDGVIRISMLLLALGVPFAMTFAWYHGERTSQNGQMLSLLPEKAVRPRTANPLAGRVSGKTRRG